MVSVSWTECGRNALTLFESRVFDLSPVGVHQSGFMPTKNSQPLHQWVNIRTLVPFNDLVGSSSRLRGPRALRRERFRRVACFDLTARVAFLHRNKSSAI